METVDCNKISVLITDILFPTKYSKWRIEDIKSFIDKYNTDILVTTKIDINNDISYPVDYEEMKDYYNLQDYNILIFDPKYNYLNKYNTLVDGTIFNNKFNSSYLFTKKLTLDLSNYDLVYHIFLHNYYFFNNHYTFPYNKQLLRLYPGGGLELSTNFIIHKDVHIISTHAVTSEKLRHNNHFNFIEALGAPMLQNNHNAVKKQINNNKLVICFSSLGVKLCKGEALYFNIVDSYIEKYPNDNIEFVTIGNCSEHKNVKRFTIKPQAELDQFYFENVDILLSLETGIAFNGWPLGVEAAIQGVVLITTDHLNSNIFFKYPLDSIFISKDIKSIITNIKLLYSNRQLLQTMSSKSQDYCLNKFSYSHQQDKVFNYIENFIIKK